MACSWSQLQAPISTVRTAPSTIRFRAAFISAPLLAPSSIAWAFSGALREPRSLATSMTLTPAGRTRTALPAEATSAIDCYGVSEAGRCRRRRRVKFGWLVETRPDDGLGLECDETARVVPGLAYQGPR